MTDVPFYNLTAEARIEALRWMKDGIDKGIRMMCQTRSHHHFVRSLHGGPAFDPVAVWESYGESTQNHFDHAIDALASINTLIAEAEQEIATRGAPPPMEPAPDTTRSKPKAAKKSAPKSANKKRPAKRKR